MPRLSTFVIPFVALSFAVESVRAQCSNVWLPGEGVPGVGGEVFAMTMWDPDGAGPVLERVLVAGAFQTTGPIASPTLSTWDPVTSAWLPSGFSVNNYVRALIVLANGDLVIGGDFTHTGMPANRIALWNGTSWSAMGSGLNGTVSALTTLPNGDLIAAGSFTNAGGVAANRVARWNGTSWFAMGQGMNGTVSALVTMPYQACAGIRMDGRT